MQLLRVVCSSCLRHQYRLSIFVNLIKPHGGSGLHNQRQADARRYTFKVHFSSLITDAVQNVHMTPF
jgi:hypothetical protein